jgi:hypothetical protein
MKIGLRRKMKPDSARRLLCAGIFLFFIHQNADAQYQLLCENLGASGGVVSSSEFALLELVGQAYPIETAANADFILHPGFIPCTLFATTTGVEEQPAAEIPTAFALRQNFPNPFLRGAKSRASSARNLHTEIVYEIPETGRVTLVIINLLGQKIKTLVDGIVRAGRHTARWEGSDDYGQNVAGGIYLYRMEAKGVVLQRRMTLIR